MKLIKDGNVFAPNLNGSVFQFSNLGTGEGTVSTYDTSTSASDIQNVFITDGQTTQATVDFNKTRFFSLGGTVRTNAAKPNDSLAAIAANGTNTTIYTTNGLQALP